MPPRPAANAPAKNMIVQVTLRPGRFPMYGAAASPRPCQNVSRYAVMIFRAASRSDVSIISQAVWM